MSAVVRGRPEREPRPRLTSPFGACVWSGQNGASAVLVRCLDDEGMAYRSTPETTVLELPGGRKPDVVLMDLTDGGLAAATATALRSAAGGLPTVAVLPHDRLAGEARLATDDFVVLPWQPGELTLRVRRLVNRGAPADAAVLRSGDLVIDTDRYDVYLAGRAIVLTFKEYQLLKLLASNPGRVYTREVLLEQVWGYEYFGGTRTVDVHVRRLRSKIEDADHTFVDTVWNVGYRFRG